MSGKKPSGGGKPTTLTVADPKKSKGALKSIGGSQSDEWNNILANQAVQSLWKAHSDSESLDLQMSATIAAMMGVGPKSELEGMLATQMIATHNAAMECYRRAMLSEQTFAGRDMALSQANRLVRSYATLVGALDKHRGKGQQTVRVEHVHVHQGGQAIVGNVSHAGRRPQEETAAEAVMDGE
ncbi:hypothetical protein [Jiella marina]|uniref:hypothetical protein n=1 Tax=Jiella sp. LLJ827 TaxID=2917712 RepID=UPI002100EC0B|nr:hypothetical protein [Jiella sp. LLJ827]MCQ0990356.1 hypothetical protein [Jiella sp. LLJ827]